VETYLRRQQQVDSREWEILSAIGVTEVRPAVENERKYISSWVEMEISDELIAMAYERTVYQKGQMNWPYMHKILTNWNQAGFRTPEQVKAGDKPVKKKAEPKGKQPENYQPTTERIQKSSDWLDEFLKQQGKEV
jgi:DnaD/phage-associated family protein